MRILVTGVAGFIGMHASLGFLNRGDVVVGIDNLNDYYSQKLKLDRLKILNTYNGFKFHKLDIVDFFALKKLFERERFDCVINLAAQAGVRYSINNPSAYGEANIIGFLNVLEACRQFSIGHLVYASSSSVYGGSSKLIFSEEDFVDRPVSLYAATKKANELMAHTYSHLYGLPTTGLRFFTVYGPWGRSDMAYFNFIENIINGKPINIFNQGCMKRDFTYIDDIVDGIVAVVDSPPAFLVKDGFFNKSSEFDGELYRIFNLGNGDPVELGVFVDIIERVVGVPAIRSYLPMQPGDVENTFADTAKFDAFAGRRRRTDLENGIKNFYAWYKIWILE